MVGKVVGNTKRTDVEFVVLSYFVFPCFRRRTCYEEGMHDSVRVCTLCSLEIIQVYATTVIHFACKNFVNRLFISCDFVLLGCIAQYAALAEQKIITLR